MRIFYTFFITLYGILLYFVSFFNEKAKKIIDGRLFLKQYPPKIPKDRKCIWLHCASAGEMEQAIPIINLLKIKNENYFIIVSFYSSSGFEQYCNTNYADYYFYLPLDTPQNAKKLIEILKPDLAIFIRYEIWWNILSALKNKNIPTYLVNANLNKKRSFFYQFYLDKTYPLFTKIFDTENYGNTKIERALLNQREALIDEKISAFCKDSFVIVLGSSWKEEEVLMAEFYRKNKNHFSYIKIIIAPHEWNEHKQNELELLFEEPISVHSSFNTNNNSSILFLDKKGILKYLYRYADIAIIGGGFGKGVHNITESVVYGTPVIFGPNYNAFEEVQELIDLNFIAFPIHNYIEFEKTLLALSDKETLTKIVYNKKMNYFEKHIDVAEYILAIILPD